MIRCLRCLGCLECYALPVSGFENETRAHAEVAVANAGVPRVAIGRGLRRFDVRLRLVDVAEHQVRVLEPAERMEILAALGELHARVELDRRLVGGDVRLADVLPHPALHEDVRRHVERVRRRGRDACIRVRRLQAERRVIGIVERVDDEVRGAGMFRVSREHLLGNRRGERLAPEAPVRGAHRAEQRQRVPRRDLVIVRPLRVHRRHRVRIRDVARELVARRVIQDVDRPEEGFLRRQLRLRLARVGRRRDLLEDLLRRVGVLLRPQRMVVAHRLAPVGHRE